MQTSNYNWKLFIKNMTCVYLYNSGKIWTVSFAAALSAGLAYFLFWLHNGQLSSGKISVGFQPGLTTAHLFPRDKRAEGGAGAGRLPAPEGSSVFRPSSLW